MNDEYYMKFALAEAQKAFNKNPSSTNWNVCDRAMMTYQQLKDICDLRHPDNGKLMFDLESNPLGCWEDVICRHTLGITCADALAYN